MDEKEMSKDEIIDSWKELYSEKYNEVEKLESDILSHKKALARYKGFLVYSTQNQAFAAYLAEENRKQAKLDQAEAAKKKMDDANKANKKLQEVILEEAEQLAEARANGEFDGENPAREGLEIVDPELAEEIANNIVNQDPSVDSEPPEEDLSIEELYAEDDQPELPLKDKEGESNG